MEILLTTLSIVTLEEESLLERPLPSPCNSLQCYTFKGADMKLIKKMYTLCSRILIKAETRKQRPSKGIK